jgi:hypothetical protein
MFREPPLNRILSDIFELLFQFRRMPDDVVEAFITLNGARTVDHLVYLAGRSTLDTLKNLAQIVRCNQPED